MNDSIDWEEVGLTVAIWTWWAAFIIGYLYCIASGGFLLGLGLGWLPAAILAYAVSLLCAAIVMHWEYTLIGVGVVALLAYIATH